MARSPTGVGPVKKSKGQCGALGIGLIRQAERDPDVAAVRQNISEPGERSRNRWIQPHLSARPLVSGDLRSRQPRAPTCQLINRAMHTATAEGRPLEHPEAIGEHTHQVRAHRLDVPARAQTRGRQLLIVQVVQQRRNPTPLIRDKGETISRSTRTRTPVAHAA